MLVFQMLKKSRSFPNPISATVDRSLVRSTYICTTHGDFNSHNILVDADGHTWLIDFFLTGRGHILRDVAQLDAVVRMELLEPTEATLDERLSMEETLLGIDRFSQIDHLKTAFPTENPALAKAYATVVHLRGLARQLVAHNPSDDFSEYHIASLYQALHRIRFLPKVQRDHALLSASLLAEKLT